MKKGGYQSNPVGERVEYPIKPFPVMIQKTRRQVEDFLGHSSHLRSNHSNIFGALFRKETWEKDDPNNSKSQ